MQERANAVGSDVSSKAVMFCYMITSACLSWQALEFASSLEEFAGIKPEKNYIATGFQK